MSNLNAEFMVIDAFVTYTVTPVCGFCHDVHEYIVIPLEDDAIALRYKVCMATELKMRGLQ